MQAPAFCGRLKMIGKSEDKHYEKDEGNMYHRACM